MRVAARFPARDRRYRPGAPYGQGLAAVLIAIIGAGCGAASTDHELTLADNLDVFEYARVDDEERQRQRIGLVPELVIGEGLQEPLYFPSWMAVDDEGNLYVLDGGALKIRVFAPDGGEVRSIGRAGQGPGEFESATGIEIQGNDLFALTSGSRLSRWTLDGTHVADYRPPSSGALFFALFKGSLGRLAIGYTKAGTRNRVLRVAAFSTEGTEEVVYAELPRRAPRQGNRAPMPAPMPAADARFATSPSGRIYTTTADEYMVSSYGDNGARSWMVRVVGYSSLLTAEDVARTMAIVRRNRPTVTEVDLAFAAGAPRNRAHGSRRAWASVCLPVCVARRTASGPTG